MDLLPVYTIGDIKYAEDLKRHYIVVVFQTEYLRNSFVENYNLFTNEHNIVKIIEDNESAVKALVLFYEKLDEEGSVSKEPISEAYKNKVMHIICSNINSMKIS